MGVTDAMVTYASSDDDDDENNRDPLNEACYRSGFMMQNKVNHTTKLHLVNVELMIEHIMKDSFQDVSWDRVWNISHVIR